MLDQAANVSEIIGTVIVIVSIIFLIVQIRQSTQALKSVTTLNLTTRTADQYKELALDEDLSIIVATGLEAPNDLSSKELSRFTMWLVSVFLNFQDLYFQREQEAYDHEQFEGIMRMFSQISAMPGFVIFWKSRKFMFSLRFQKFVDNELKGLYTATEFSTLTVKTEGIE